MADDTSRTFGANLTKLMKQQGLSFRRLADMTGIPFNTINDYANAKVSIPLDKAKMLATALGKSLEEMTGNMTRKDLKKSAS